MTQYGVCRRKATPRLRCHGDLGRVRGFTRRTPRTLCGNPGGRTPTAGPAARRTIQQVRLGDPGSESRFGCRSGRQEPARAASVSATRPSRAGVSVGARQAGQAIGFRNSRWKIRAKFLGGSARFFVSRIPTPRIRRRSRRHRLYWIRYCLPRHRFRRRRKPRQRFQSPWWLGRPRLHQSSWSRLLRK